MHRLPCRTAGRRVIAGTGVATVIVAGAIAGSAIANNAASASTRPSAGAPGAHAARGSVIAGADAGIERLVAENALSRAQGDAIEQQINAGSVDPKQLVDSGVVTDPQMRVAANAIAQAKRAGA